MMRVRNVEQMNTTSSPETSSERLTPMMTQYLEIKTAYPGYLLFYRMGDFYELFFDDAEVASRALGIALTKRGKHLGADIPMCGVPIHASDQYLQKLIRLEHRVAVCEQVEDPAEAKKRGAKSVVRRNVIRLVTPGTLTEDTLLDSRANNFVAALVALRGQHSMAIAWADISSGIFSVLSTDDKRLPADLARLEPRELILSESLYRDPVFVAMLQGSTRTALTAIPDTRFDSVSGEKLLKDHFKLASFDGLGTFSRAEIAALGSLLDYILITQVGHVPHLRLPRREDDDFGLLIDAATRNNLELTRKLSGEKAGSLLSILDQTTTAAGSRLLAHRLAQPLAQAGAIEARLDEVSFFHGNAALRAGVRKTLAAAPDLERALGRLVLGRGGPRDLAAIAKGLGAADALGTELQLPDALDPLPANLLAARSILRDVPHQLISGLEQALAADLPLLARDGGFIRAGYSADLDSARSLRDDTRQVIAALQTEYAEKVGIKSLKIRHNNMLGYYIEVSAQNAEFLRDERHAGEFYHRQTMAGAMRFSTATLSQLEQKIASAAERALAIEMATFDDFVQRVVAEKDRISTIAAALAAIDVAAGLAELAERNRYCRPRVDHSTAFAISGGRHPVVESVLQAQGHSSFIANDCDLSPDGHRLWLLTGPNMAGKSTYLRQNALIAIMAQMGSFVPARAAHIGIVDRLFSRVGAADDLARGRSTFMVEMVETAAILNQASERSLVILDEIGRGTATFDGLSIAWATVEHLHEVNKCRALFATHYHELTALAAKLKSLANATVRVREWHGDVVFLHEVVAGVADRSYGIQVARLAGLPEVVTQRAAMILDQLEKSERAIKRETLIDDLPLFTAAQAAPPAAVANPKLQALATSLAAVDPDAMTPRAAHEFLYQLLAQMKDAG
jgi:DNA mismatch repair protein MutS